MTDKLLNYYLTVGRDKLHKLGINFNFENTTITQQEVSNSMKPPNCTAKEFFVIKEIAQFELQLKELNKCKMQNIRKLT